MESLEGLIKNRRTIQQFKPQKIPDALVMKALELSLWAPNHRLTFPWQYRLVNDEDCKKFIDLAVELKREKDPSFSKIKEVGLKKRLGEASHWVALGIHKNPNPHIFQEDQCTLACSVQIASLYLWDQGIGSKWSSSGFTTHPRAYEILGMKPESHHLMGALFIGVPEVIPAAKPRPSLDQVLGSQKTL